MLSRVFTQQHTTWLFYSILGILVIVLVATGYFIGNLVTINTKAENTTVSTGSGSPSSGAIVDPPHLLQDFTLTSHTGAAINLSDLRGRAVLLFFGYTHCPDICPMTLVDYTRIKAALGDEAEKVAFVFISVDGERDKPQVIAEYLRHFDTDFIGMTGDEVTLRRISREYGLFFGQERIDFQHQHSDGQEDQHHLDDEDYFVQHTSPSFLIDSDGYLRMVYFYGTEPEIVAQSIKGFLK